MGQVLNIDPLKPDIAVLETVAVVLREGGIIVYPTDTIYGLGCSIKQVNAIERVFEVKRRPARKGALVLVPRLDTVTRLCPEVPDTLFRLASRFWPGPVTFLVPARAELSHWIKGERGLVGVRNPDSQYLHLLMEMVGAPLLSTSANLSGAQSSGNTAELKKIFAPQVDLFLDGGDVSVPTASTVVDLSVEPPVVVRPGVLNDDVQQALTKL
ncbi:MAG TPA: L-threonylcarbamoyladenylate synthase [Acidobacteriota bacterium]|nr:L-threonylcarbamoyladenylate synthase [Acidobacteriota bacterium]